MPTGLSPSLVRLSCAIRLGLDGDVGARTPGRSPVWALPRSLAATDGIEVSFCSSGYLDVSVPQVCFDTLCIQMPMTRRVAATRRVAPFGNPRIGACSSSPGLIAGNHVLLRRLTPRHPPHALHSLIASTCGRRPSFTIIHGNPAKPTATIDGTTMLRAAAPQTMLSDAASHTQLGVACAT